MRNKILKILCIAIKAKVFDILLCTPLALFGQGIDTCHLSEYPELHTEYFPEIEEGVFQTIPFEKVEFLGSGVYAVTHPDVHHECDEVVSPVVQTSSKNIKLYEEVRLYLENHPNLRSQCSFAIQQIMIDMDEDSYYWSIYCITVPLGFRESPK